MLNIYLSRHQFEMGGAKPEVVSSAPKTGTRGQTLTEKGQKQARESLDWL